MLSRRHRRVVAAVSALALTAGILQLGAVGPAAAKSGSFSSQAEAAKMDAIKTPKLDWFTCYQTAECATVKVSRDYDDPKGATVELALLRVRLETLRSGSAASLSIPAGRAAPPSTSPTFPAPSSRRT